MDKLRRIQLASVAQTLAERRFSLSQQVKIPDQRNRLLARAREYASLASGFAPYSLTVFRERCTPEEFKK